MARLKKKSYDELTAEQREVFDQIAEGRSGVEGGHIGGPFDAWILNPEMGRRIVGLGGLFRFRTTVDRRYIELAILMAGRKWQAQYEWYAHEPMARDAGVPDSVIAGIKTGEAPEFNDEGDRAAFNLCNELLETHHVSDGTYQAALSCFGEVGVSEIVNVTGYYTMVSMTLNAFDVPLPDGADYPFPRQV